jgi:hypothetical protein
MKLLTRARNTLATLAAIVALLVAFPNVGRSVLGTARLAAQNVNCYFSQGGSALTAGSGCTVTIASGGTIAEASGSTHTLGGTTLTSTAAEQNVLHGVTPGTVAASSAVVVDANSALAGLKSALGGAATTSPGTMLGGLTDVSNVASGTAQNTEYTLNSVTLPANAFNANGRAIRCEAWAQTAANANAKNIKVYFGATAVATVTGTTASGKDVHMELNVLRTGASTQSAQAIIQVDTGVAPTMATAAPTETDTAPIVVSIKSADTGAAAASATGKGLSCYFIN